MKRIFAICVMVLALGCGSMTNEEKLEGTWVADGRDNEKLTLVFILPTTVRLSDSFPSPPNNLVGTFSIRDDRLTILWGDGRSNSLDFSINGDELTLTHISGYYSFASGPNSGRSYPGSPGSTTLTRQ